MKQIPLTKGYIALVDDEDYDHLCVFKWCFDGSGYAIRGVTLPNGRRSTIRMHRHIMGNPKGLEIDHIDNNRLNNQRSNLRICTRVENSCNMSKPKINTSGYKGLRFCKRTNKWVAQIKHHKIARSIGYFNTKEEAARAYDKAAKDLHGSFAKLNFVE